MNLHYLTLTRDVPLLTALRENLDQWGGTLHVLEHAGSICSGYNELFMTGVKAGDISPADILCFIHEDARLHFEVEQVMQTFFSTVHDAGVVGFVGTREVDPADSRFWLRPAHLIGGLYQGGTSLKGDPDKDRNVWYQTPSRFIPKGAPDGIFDLRYEPVIQVDGFCMFIRAHTFKAIGMFDAATFTKFHCYDADLCRTALKFGYQNYVIDQPSQHFSGGSLADPWPEENAKFCKKWSGQ